MDDNSYDTGHYEGVVLEDIQHKLTTILEGQQSMASVPGDIAVLKSDVADIKIELSTMKTVLTDHSGQLNNHEGRITSLEKATA